jgi:hypothetical protein
MQFYHGIENYVVLVFTVAMATGEEDDESDEECSNDSGEESAEYSSK